MKLFKFNSVVILALLALVSCTDSELIPTPANNGDPVSGELETIKSGTLTAQSATNTRGTIALVLDQEKKYFIRLSEDFTTKFSTGTVTVYLSNSNALNLNRQESYQLVSVVGKAGEHFFSLPNKPDEKFTHGIIWCGAAGIPFGFAELK